MLSVETLDIIVSLDVIKLADGFPRDHLILFIGKRFFVELTNKILQNK